MTKFYRGKFDPWLWSMISTLYYIWPLKLTYSTCEKIKSQYCTSIKYLKLYCQRCSFLKPYRKTNQKDKKQCVSRLWFLKNCLVWSQILRYYSAEIWLNFLKKIFKRNLSQIINYVGHNNPNSNPPPPCLIWCLSIFFSIIKSHTTGDQPDPLWCTWKKLYEDLYYLKSLNNLKLVKKKNCCNTIYVKFYNLINKIHVLSFHSLLMTEKFTTFHWIVNVIHLKLNI